MFIAAGGSETRKGYGRSSNGRALVGLLWLPGESEKGAWGAGSGEGVALTAAAAHCFPACKFPGVPQSLGDACQWGKERGEGEAPTRTQEGESVPDIFMNIHITFFQKQLCCNQVL